MKFGNNLPLGTKDKCIGNSEKDLRRKLRQSFLEKISANSFEMNNFSDISYDFDTKLWMEFLDKAFETEQNKMFYAILLCIIFLFSVMTNTLTCFIIYYVKSMHTVTNFYLFNLAISDLLLTFTMIPDIYDSFNPRFECSQMVCITFWFLTLCLCNSGILTLTALSIERYFAVWYPLRLKSNSEWHRVLKTIIFLWLLAIAETLPDIMTVSVVRIRENNVCFPIPTSLAKLFHVIQGISTFILPLIIMISVYSSILFKVNTDAADISEKICNNYDTRGKVNKLIGKFDLLISV